MQVPFEDADDVAQHLERGEAFGRALVLEQQIEEHGPTAEWRGEQQIAARIVAASRGSPKASANRLSCGCAGSTPSLCADVPAGYVSGSESPRIRSARRSRIVRSAREALPRQSVSGF